MIDQFIAGLSQPVPSARTATYDRQQTDAGRQENGTESFGDMVSRAGQQQNRGDREPGANPGGGHVGEQSRSSADDASRPAYDLSLAQRSLASSPDGRQKLAGFKDALKAVVDTKARQGESDEALLARLTEKLKAAAKNSADRTGHATDDAEALASSELTPADELGLLLGLHGTRETEGKADRKGAKSRTDETDKKDAGNVHSKEHGAKSDSTVADQILASAAIESGKGSSNDEDGKNGAVRVVSADGRGRSVDISLSKVTSEQGNDSDKSGVSARVDTATVLEARRYLGFTQDTNATALANAVKGDPGWTAALDAADRLDTGMLGNTITAVNTLKLQMNPENLGSMVASLRLKGDELTVELQVTSAEAYRHLSADHDEIVKALQDQGFSIDKVTVQLNAADRTDTGADRDMSRQGQMQRDGQGAQPDTGNGRGNRSNPAFQPEARDLVADDGAAGAQRSSGVYL